MSLERTTTSYFLFPTDDTVSMTAMQQRTSKSSGQNSCFFFERSRVQISAWKPAILTEGFRDFPQTLQANAGMVS
jgi:hypothetical protein